MKFYGQPLGVIVADTMQLANYAAGFVEIEYELQDQNKKILPTLKDVLSEERSRVVDYPHFSSKSKEFGVNTVHKLTGHLEQGIQYHFTMETQTCVVIPIEDGIDVYSATQWINNGQIAIADALHIPNNLVNMNVRRVGGAYGGKITRAGQISCATAVAAFLLNRPVRFVMTLEQNMTIVGKRYSCYNDYEIEIDDNGKIQKLKNDYVQDSGCSPNEPVHFNTTEFFKNCYESKSWDINAKGAITEAPSNTFCRAPGTTEGIGMIEQIMEHIAKKVGKDPVDVRMANIPEDSELKTIIPEFIQSVGKFNLNIIRLFNLN